jgi:hypothetical protein
VVSLDEAVQEQPAVAAQADAVVPAAPDTTA